MKTNMPIARHWHEPPRAQQSCWLRWAALLRGRLRRIASRHGSPPLQLLQRPTRLCAAAGPDWRAHAAVVVDAHNTIQVAWHVHPSANPGMRGGPREAAMQPFRGNAGMASPKGRHGAPILRVDRRVALHFMTTPVSSATFAPLMRVANVAQVPQVASPVQVAQDARMPGVQPAVLASVRTIVEHARRVVVPNARGAERVRARSGERGFVEQTLQRVVRRTTRVETQIAAGPGIVDRHPADRGPRASGSARGQAQQVLDAPAASRLAAVDTTHTAPWLTRGEATLDVERIATQVMRQIDDRMTAWRERMGKF